MSNVTFDFSFAEDALKFLKSNSEIIPDYLLNHSAAKIIHAHYSFFHYSGKLLSRKELMDDIFKKMKPSDIDIKKIKNTLSYLKENVEELSYLAAEEALQIAPKNYDLSSTIFIGIGYDIGIVFNGSVVMNISHKLYLDNPREVLYFAIHELSHVVLYSYQPPFRFSDLKSKEDIIKVLKFHTHLEGLGVITPYEIRKREQDFNHIDYQTLQDSEKMIVLDKKFRTLIKEAEKGPEREIEERDWKSIEICSDERLWYTVGCKMAQSIINSIGMNELIDTIEKGYESFFEKYEEAQNR